MTWPGYENFIPPGPIGEDGRVTVAKRSKYGNRKTTLDGITFDSAKEARRWQELKLLEKAGEIHGLRRQFNKVIVVHGKHVCTYVADFVYCVCDSPSGCVNWPLVIEDVKSPASRTAVYMLKKKLVKACYGIDITEV